MPGGFSESAVGAAWGSVFDRGQVMLAFEHVTRDNLSGDDRDFFTADQTSRGGRDYRVTRCAPGTLRIGTTSYAIPAGGVTQANASSLVAGTANRCNDLIGQDLFPEQKYNTAATTATFDLSDRVSLFADGFFSEREFLRKSAFSSATLTVPQTNAFFVRPAGFAGTSYTVDYSFINDVPQNDTSGQARNWQVTPGLRVKLARDWQVEGLMGYGETEDEANAYYGTQQRGAERCAREFQSRHCVRSVRTEPHLRCRSHRDCGPDLPRAHQERVPWLRAAHEWVAAHACRAATWGLAAGLERQDIDVGLGSARGGPTTPITFRHFERQVDSAYLELSVPLFGAEQRARRPASPRAQRGRALRRLQRRR